MESMRPLALLPLALILAGGCKPPKKDPEIFASKDRRVVFGGVSLLVPAGMGWGRREGPRMAAVWKSERQVYLEVTSLPKDGSVAQGDRAEIERRWRRYLPQLQRAVPKIAVPPAEWSQLGPNDYFSTRLRHDSGREMRTGFLMVGDRAIMLAFQYPDAQTKTDPAALPALERLAASIRPTEGATEAL